MTQLIRIRRAVASFGVVLVSCGPARPVQLPNSSSTSVSNGINANQSTDGTHSAPSGPGNSSAELLGLRVLWESSATVGTRASKEPEPISNLEDVGDFDGSAIRGESGISYRSLLPVLAPRALFFVWPETFMNSVIVQVGVRRSVLDGHNRWNGIPGVIPAERDPRLGRWFICLSTLFQGTVVPTETHRLTLDLLLADQRRQVVEIHFRVTPIFHRER